MPYDAGKILNYLFLLSIITSFLPNAIYVFFFAMYIGLGLIYLMKKRDEIINVPKGSILLLIGLSGFLIYGCMMIVFGEKNIDNINLYLKLPLNILFIITFILCSSIHKIEYEKVFRVVYFCLILSFTQVNIALIQTDSFTLFLNGINSSNAAFQITQTKIWFGNEAKNIWATKILLIALPVVLYRLNTRRVMIDWIMLLFLFYCSLMTFSRTALLAFLIAITIFLMIKVFQSKKVYKYIFLLISPYLIYKIFEYVYSNLMRITLSSTDGLYSRLVMYDTVFDNLDRISFFGEGLYAASKILPMYSYEYFGELYIHNVFINSYLDLGFLGLTFYCCFLLGFGFLLLNSLPKNLSWSLLLTFLLIVISQYVGYDNDLIIFIALTYIISLDTLSNRQSIKQCVVRPQ